MDTQSGYKHLSQNLRVFLKELYENPRNIGAICPSSPFLAAEVAKNVIVKPNEMVIELGTGTGVVTEALLKRGIKPEQIIGIEYSADLIERFKIRFPNIKIIQGDAAHLIKLLEGQHLQVGSVVSSLPLSIFPLNSVQTILDQIKQALQPGGRYVSFTYRFKENTYGRLQNFKKVNSKWVWLNIPPARVDTYSV
jgi:phosphatidylethanolamine/phosphatidyl-N-methylethanolamine N-methyltransferase